MPYCAGHVGLDPKWIAGFARPDTRAGRSRDCLAGGALGNHSTGRVLFGSVGARDTPQYKSLLTCEVAFVESNPISLVFDGVVVEVDLELVTPFWMVAGYRDVARDRGAHVNHKRRTCLTAENIEIRDIEADILASNW